MFLLFKFFKQQGPAPPKESGLRAAVDKLRAARIAGPEVVFDSSGALFDKFMIESDASYDYKTFLDEVSMLDKK